ncbi:MAG: FGGY-family carbohydrate kinase [Actinobacteria bacterium]|nr:FGGY-family carbohydrate kinase [Actinomycetota bacterium]
MTAVPGEPWILAIDLGNGGPKVAAVSLTGEILAHGMEGVAVTIDTDGTATQDPLEWLSALETAVADLADSVSRDQLHAVAITGQWGSSVPVGADGTPVGPVLLWADTRGGRHVAPIVAGRVTVAGYAPHKVLPWLRITGGIPSNAGDDPTGHWQVLSHELADVGRRTSFQLEPVDFLAAYLTGIVAATPASMVLSWLTDNRLGATPRYVPELVTRSRRPADTLPPLRPTGSVQGSLLPETAERLRLPAGVPVITGIPDFHAAALGSGAVTPYATHLAVSTTAWLSAPVPFKKTDIFHTIATVPGLQPELPLVINNIDTAGAALTWLREQVIAPADGLSGGGSGIGAAGAAPPGAPPSFEALTELAAQAPVGCEGVLFAPWLAGEHSPVADKRIRATWLNLSLRTDRATMVRSVLEGVAFSTRWLLGHYEKFLGREVTEIRILGGGAQSDVWCQIFADVLDVRLVRIAAPRQAQVRGVALWARVCLGELTLSEAAGKVPLEREFVPDPDNRVEYDRLFDTYRTLYSTLRKTYRRLNASH